MRTVETVIKGLTKPRLPELPTPKYTGISNSGVFLGCESMSKHTADAGWQLTLGFSHGEYTLCGYNLGTGEVNAQKIIEGLNPGIAVLQDKREWLGHTAKVRGKNQQERFTHLDALKSKDDMFKLTVLKDAQQQPQFHRQSAEEIGCHAWITYYHPDIVKQVAPYVRKEHLVRTYHSVDADAVPEFDSSRLGECLLSGAVSGAYPLRQRLVRYLARIPSLDYAKHPGYHARGCVTNDYLRLLSEYKVAVCTSSMYGYSLRKIVEATACGCVVITDLPIDDILPHIDGNLVRINPRISIQTFKQLLVQLAQGYDAEKQRQYASLATEHYDYRYLGKKLCQNIERLRETYNG